MAVTFIGKNAVPNYTCLSTDIVNGTLEKSYINGATVFSLDDGQWYIVKEGHTLEKYYNPMSNITFSSHQISLDAGSRLRVGQLRSLGDYKILNADNTLLWENSGDGTGAFSNNTYQLSVALENEYLISQTKVYHPYFSGKSQLVEMTFDSFHPVLNVTKRLGYFSSNATAPYDSDFDGFFIESSNGSISFKVYNSGTSILDLDISEWSGYSNLWEYKDTDNWENFTVVLFDFLWLGGAILRLWVKTSHGFILAHDFDYSGVQTGTFVLSPNQPIRYEIRSTGGSGELTRICSQVSTEGSTNEVGITRFVDTGTTYIPANSVSSTYLIKAIRKKVAYRDVAVAIKDIQIGLGTNEDKAKWILSINPTFSSSPSFTDVSNSSFQEATGTGAITLSNLGVIIAGGIVESGVPVGGKQLEENYMSFLQCLLDNTMEIFCLSVMPFTVNTNVYAGISLKQY